MRLLTFTAPEARPSPGIFRQMIPGGIITHPRPAQNAAQPKRRAKKQTVPAPADGPEYLIFWRAEHGVVGNTYMTVPGGRITRRAIAEIIGEIQRLNGWKKNKPIIIANLIALEKEAA